MAVRLCMYCPLSSVIYRLRRGLVGGGGAEEILLRGLRKVSTDVVDCVIAVTKIFTKQNKDGKKAKVTTNLLFVGC